RAQNAPLVTAAPLRLRARDTDERLADEGLVGHADDRARAVVERDERGPVQVSQDEAARAVDGIDHPRPGLAPLLRAVLLAADAVAGIALGDRLPYHRFRGAIGLGHRVVAA